MAVKPVRIPTLTQRQPIVDKDGRASVEFLRTINSALTTIGYALNAILVLPSIKAALDGFVAQANIAGSYPSGASLTASDAGTSATITISAHTRVYGDGSSVPVNAGSVTGLAYETQYYIKYEDPSRSGGAVNYMAVTDPAQAAQMGDTHVVGSATTPAAGGTEEPGDPVYPPGPGNIRRPDQVQQ